MSLLFSLRPEPYHRYESHDWLRATHLMERAPVRLCTDGGWDAAGVTGGLVCPSDGDLATLRRLRQIGVPGIFAPWLGPVTHGSLVDGDQHSPEHRLRTRLLMQSAHAVLAESWTQAEAAQAHYGIAPFWLVLPEGTTASVPPRRADPHPLVLWTVEPVDHWAGDLYEWSVAAGFTATRCTLAQAVAGLDPARDLLFWPEGPWTSGEARDVAQSGVRVVAPPWSAADAPLPGLCPFDPHAPTALLPAALTACLASPAPAHTDLPLASWDGWNGWDAWADGLRGCLHRLRGATRIGA